ncbi:Hypothetical_protein [Hexamita inflata]|uniref:Hypothetical_protein n=1 Tax=Hexamita inflata TaxID=28002 RepID=A0AA86NKE8_9EUKA|nr:Hypothetical protein HINF_LOCUS8593 [Hexamita inflata]
MAISHCNLQMYKSLTLVIQLCAIPCNRQLIQNIVIYGAINYQCSNICSPNYYVYGIRSDILILGYLVNNEYICINTTQFDGCANKNSSFATASATRFVGLHLYTELQRSGERRKSSLGCHLTQNQRAAHIVKSQSEMKVHVSNQICTDFVQLQDAAERRQRASESFEISKPESSVSRPPPVHSASENTHALKTRVTSRCSNISRDPSCM